MADPPASSAPPPPPPPKGVTIAGQNPNVVVAPRLPVSVFLVPTVPSAAKHDYYFGMSEWTKQWESADTKHRKRLQVTTTAIDETHKIATLQTCIAATVAGYTSAVAALNALDPKAPGIIDHGLGHGALGDDKSSTTADFGAQLEGFSKHEFRVAMSTFELYKTLRKAKSFGVALTNPNPSPKDRAHHLLAFDGLVAIRNAIKGRVSRLRIVTCRIGDDLKFLTSLAWILGRCRKNEPPTNNIIIEAYKCKVGAYQVNAASPWTLRLYCGLVLNAKGDIDWTKPNPEDPNDHDPTHNTTTELPWTDLTVIDPSTIVSNPADPLYDPGDAAALAVELGECESLASMIPADVLKK